MIVKLDQLCRIVVPAQWRHELGLEPQSHVEMDLDGGQIVLKPLDAICVFCGNVADVPVGSKGICEHCIEVVKRL